MKKKSIINANELLSLASGALISGLILFAVFAFKGIWPFGNGNVTYDDMAQGFLPYYYHIYDWLHGEKALMWDWYSGLGVSVANSGAVTPLDLIMLFFKRDNILYSLGVLLIVRCMASAVTARFFFNRVFPNTNDIVRTAFSVTYALNAYSMFYYTNLQWLDFVILFPLILYGLLRLLRDDKPALYIATYAVALMLSVYLSYMVSLAIFFVGGLYILLIIEKGKKARRTLTLGVSTITGILLSGWRLIPLALQTLSSKRLETSFDSHPGKNPILVILEDLSTDYLSQKLCLFIGVELAFLLTAYAVVMLFKNKSKKKSVFLFGTLFFTASPVLFENINLIWHGGSYVWYPMRFAYIPIFLVLCFGLYSLERYSDSFKPIKSKALKTLNLIMLFAFTAAFAYALYFTATNYGGTMDEAKTKSAVMLICAVSVLVTGIPMFALSFGLGKQFFRSFCMIICMLESFAVAYSGVANTHYRQVQQSLYHSESFVEYCQEVDDMDTDSGVLGRIRNKDTSLNCNYPFLLGTQALSNWTHNIPQYMQQAAVGLGYSSQYTRMLDSGGTAFSDAILGIKKLVVRSQVPVSRQFRLIDETQNFRLYENSYPVEFGLLADESILESITDRKAYEKYDIQNELFELFTGEEELICVCGTDGDNSASIDMTEITEKTVTFEYMPGKNEVLYLNAADFGKTTMRILVNGERVLAPYYKHTTYGAYPSSAVNGFLELGSFDEGESVEIKCEVIGDGDIIGKIIQLGSLPLDKLTALDTLYKDVVSNEQMGKTSLSFDYNNPTGKAKYLFIPVSYDNGWSCRINGEKAQVHQALGAYLCVELPTGSGSVEMSYRVNGFRVGLVLTAVGIAAVLVIFLLRKRKGAVPGFVAKPVFWLFAAVYAAAVVAVYAVPIGFFIKDLIN